MVNEYPDVSRDRASLGDGEHQAVLLPLVSRSGAFLSLTPLLIPERLDGDLRRLQRPSRPVGLGVPVSADRIPRPSRPRGVSTSAETFLRTRS